MIPANSTQFLVTFDYTALTNYFASGASLNRSLHAEVLRNGVLKNTIERSEIGVTPPWRIEQPELPDAELGQRVFSNKPLFDLDDPSIDRPDVDESFKSLFALYKGLARMKELSEYAQTREGQALATLLEAKFQSYVEQVRSFVEGTRFADISLVPGLKTDTLISTVNRSTDDPLDTIFQLPIRDTYFGAIATSVREDPIPGLNGDESFTIHVTKNGTTTDVAIDLANAASTQIDDIVSYINSQMVAAGFPTTFSTERHHETAYGLKIALGSGETLSFTADAATESEAVYVAGRAGGGPYSRGFLVKLDDLNSADPNQVFYQSINASLAYDSANAVTVDSAGYVYVVGTTAGSLDDQINEDGNDVYLVKYDPSGQMVYTRMLGSATSAAGFAVTVDGNDDVIVAGQAFGPLTSSAYGGGGDTFVTKFDSGGQELWTRQAAPFAGDGALDITVDSSNNIFISGFTRGAIATNQSHGGGTDAFVTKLGSDGALLYNSQFGGAGEEVATGLAVNSSGDVFVVGTADGDGFLRKYNASDASLAYELDLGATGTDGGITGVAVNSTGDLYISGYTTNTALDASVKNAHSGATDAFVLSVDDQPSSGSVQWVTYLGTSGIDRGHGVAVDTSNDGFYLTGETDGTLPGETKSAAVDAFVAKFDNQGSLQYTHQFGSAFSHTGLDIVFDSNGTTALSRLGLPNGSVPPQEATTIVSQTTVRADQSFDIVVNGGPPTRITIENEDNLRWLAFKINQALGTHGKASVEEEGTGERLVIHAVDGAEIEFRSGPEGFDALTGLGLRATRLFSEPANTDEKKAAASSAFELGLVGNLNVLSMQGAEEVVTILDNAMREVRGAYRFLTEGPPPDDPFAGIIGPPPPYLAARIAAFEDALARIQAFNSGFGGGLIV